MCLSVKGWCNVIFYGVCLGVMNIIFYFVIECIFFGIGVVFEFIGLLVVVFFSVRKKWDFVWVILVVVGVCLLFFDIGGVLVESLDFVGVIFVFIVGVFWVGYIVFGNKIGNEGFGGVMVILGMLVVVICVVFIGVVS